jgi:hypothetical protein
MRRKRVAIDDICGGGHPQPRDVHPSRIQQSPTAYFSRDGDEFLEIYDSHVPYPKQRKRRPRGRVQRDVQVKLSSSSGSSTDSGQSHSFTEGILSNEESMPSYQNSASMEELEAGPVTISIVGPKTPDAMTSSNSSMQRSTDIKADKWKATAGSASSKGSKSGASFLCCIFPSIVKPSSRPGMSLTEEKRLWRDALEGNHEVNDKSSLIVIGDEREIDQIEVVPVDQSFQTQGAVNYAEMEGTGMLFAPSVPGGKPVSRSHAPKAWWLHESGTDSSYRETATGAQDASPTRISTYTKKTANRRGDLSPGVSQSSQFVPQQSPADKPSGMRASDIQEKEIQRNVFRRKQDSVAQEQALNESSDGDSLPRRQQVQSERRNDRAESLLGDEGFSRQSTDLGPFEDVSYSDLDESLDHRIQRIERQRNSRTSPLHEALNFASTSTHRPYQVFEAKPGRRKGLVSDWHEKSGMSYSDTSLEIDIPHLNHSYRASSLECKADLPPRPMGNGVSVNFETVQGESWSEIPSESDLSEILRQRDAKEPKGKLEEQILSQCAQQRSGEKGACRDALVSGRSKSLLPPSCLGKIGDARKPMNDSKNIAMTLEDESCMRQGAEIGPQLHESNRNARSPRCDNGSISPILLRGRPPYDYHDPGTHESIAPKFVTSKAADREFSQRRNETNSPIRLYEDSPYVRENNVSPMIPVFSGINSEQSRWMKHRHYDSQGRSDNLRRRSSTHIDLTSRSAPNSPIKRRSRSPIRLYGDPPTPRRMDGSPVRSPRSLERDHSRPLLDNFENDPARERDGTLSELRELALNQGNLMHLIAALSPNKEPAAANRALSNAHPIPDGSGVLLFKPTINIYNGQPETVNDAGQPHKRAANSLNKCLAYEKREKQCPNNSTGIKFKELRREKPQLHIQTTDSDCENVVAANLYGSPLTRAMWATPEATVPIDDDDSSIDEELRQLAASEKLLRKELEEVQQRSAERRWQFNFPGVCDTEKFVLNSRHRGTRTFNERFGGAKAAGISDPASDNAVVGTRSSIIDLSCVDDVASENTMTLASGLPVAQTFQGAGDRRANRHGYDLIRKKGYSYVHSPVGQFTDVIAQVHGRDGEKEEEIEVIFVEDDFENSVIFADDEPRRVTRLTDTTPYLWSNESTRIQRSACIDTMAAHTETEAQSKQNSSSHEHSNIIEILSERGGDSDSDALKSQCVRDPKRHRDRMREVALSPFQEREASSQKVEDTSFAFCQSASARLRDSDGLYVPFFADEQPNYDGSTADAKCSCVDSEMQPVQETGIGGDVLIDRELSWRAVEQLYHLAPRDDSDVNGARREDDLNIRMPFQYPSDECYAEQSQELANTGLEAKTQRRHFFVETPCGYNSELGSMDCRRVDSADNRPWPIHQLSSATQNGAGGAGSKKAEDHDVREDHCYSPALVELKDVDGSPWLEVVAMNPQRHVSRNVTEVPFMRQGSLALDKVLKEKVGSDSSFTSMELTRDKMVSRPVKCANRIYSTSSCVSITDLQMQHTGKMENLSRNQIDDGDTGDDGSVSSTSFLDSIEIDSADRSLYSMLLRYDQPNNPNGANFLRRRPPQDPEISRRLHSLLLRHGRTIARDINNDTTGSEVDQHKDEDNGDDEKVHGIYAELVRRGRLSGRDRIGHDTSVAGATGNMDHMQRRIELAAKVFLEDSHETVGSEESKRKGMEADGSTSGERPVDRHNSPTKRLQRLRKLQSKMQPLASENAPLIVLPESVKQPHLSRKLTGARQRASKSLRRNVVKKGAAEGNTAEATVQGHHDSTSRVRSKQEKGFVDRESNVGGLVEVYMQVTGGPHLGNLKSKKKDAEHASRELNSIASSTRSKDLVHSLPAAAKTRNVAAAKPGR